MRRDLLGERGRRRRARRRRAAAAAVLPARSPIRERDADAAMVDAIQAAGGAVRRGAVDDAHRPRAYPSCTLVSARCWRDGEVAIGWVGDSRAYWLDADDDAPADRR